MLDFLPVRLLPADRQSRFSVGQTLTFREKGGRFACIVESIVAEYAESIGIWYQVRFEGTQELQLLPQHALNPSRDSIIQSPPEPTPAVPSPIPTVALAKPKSKKRNSGERTPAKLQRQPTYVASSEDSVSVNESPDFQIAPRIRRSSLSVREEQEEVSEAESWLVCDVLESPEKKKVRASSKKVTENVEKPGKKIRRNARVEYEVGGSYKFVHRDPK